MEAKENSQNQEPETLIKEIIKEILEKMGFSFELELIKNNEEEAEKIDCNIITSDSSFLIGQYGANLEALQHIARLLIRKKITERINFTLDVNSYRKEKNESTIQLARHMAEQAIAEKRAVVLRPMSPYERRIVHMELSENDQVATESIGEGEERKIIIKPISLV
jgi:spoIIIJ-associated protein